MWLLSAIVGILIGAWAILSSAWKEEHSRNALIGGGIVFAVLLVIAFCYDAMLENIDDPFVFLFAVILFFGLIGFFVLRFWNEEKEKETVRKDEFNRCKEQCMARCMEIAKQTANMPRQNLVFDSYQHCMEMLWKGLIGVRVNHNDLESLFIRINEYSASIGRESLYSDTRSDERKIMFNFDTMPLTDAFQIAYDHCRDFGFNQQSVLMCDLHEDGIFRQWIDEKTIKSDVYAYLPNPRIISYDVLDALYQASVN